MVRGELRKVIRGVLSDIYFAHIATLFMENLIGSELKGIARESFEGLEEQRIEEYYYQTTSAIQILD